MALLRDFKAQASASNAPVTVGIVALSAVSFLAAWISTVVFWDALTFSTSALASKPWSLVTYPFSGDSFIGLVFISFWFWGIGGGLERELRSAVYLGFFLAMTILPALTLAVGASIFSLEYGLFGLYLPVAGVTVAWATRNPSATVMLMCVLPIQARWIGWITAGGVLFGYGVGNPIVGVLAALPLLLAYLYARGRIPFIPWASGPTLSSKQPERKGWRPQERDDAFLERVREREREREEKDRLRALFEQSVNDDEDKG